MNDPGYGIAYYKVGPITAAQAFETATVAAWGVIEKPNGEKKPVLLLRLPTAGTAELVVVPQPEE